MVDGQRPGPGALGTTATADEITDTAVTQPLVVAATLLAHEELTKRGLLTAETVVAGHSVGEIAAYAIAGVISTDDAVALAATRGAEMAKACARSRPAWPRCSAATRPRCWAAWRPRPGARQPQRGRPDRGRRCAVRAGQAGRGSAAKARVRGWPPPARSTPLHGVGPGWLRQRGAGVTTAEPTATLLSNADGQPVASAADAMGSWCRS